MFDLDMIFDALVTASSNGCFEAALMESPLGTVTLHSHPLGFRVARVSDGGVHLRLHLWTSSAKQLGFEVHDHSFNLKSHIVDGAIRQITYKAHNDPEGDQCVYLVAYEDNRSILRKSDVTMRLEELGQDVFHAGTTYLVQAGQLHLAERHDCATAISLALTHEIGGVPITIGPRNGPNELVAARSLLSERLLMELGLRAALFL